MLKIYISFFFFSILLTQSNSLSFQDNLFKKFNEKTTKGNFMISPLSIYQFLGLFANGASGDTKKDFLQGLFPEKNINENMDSLINELNSNAKEINTIIESEDKEDSHFSKTCLKEEECKIRFNIANGIFVKEGFELTEDFKQKCDNYNISYFELIDVGQLNQFVSERTNGKINKVETLLPPYVNLVIINAIYFKGMWEDKFSEENTQKRTFVNSDNTNILVETMSQKYYSQKYYEDENVQIIALPYKSNKLDFNMIIILPNSNKYSSPSDYLNKENIVLSEIYSKLKTTENIHLYLPKFKLNYNNKIIGLLAEIGIHFDEFNNLLNNSQPSIEDILHKTYIDLNENGTEAAAITVNVFNGTIFEPEEDYIMDVNHSFIYMIQSNDIKDSEGNFLLPFIGIVNNLMNPTNEDSNADEFKNAINSDEASNTNEVINSNEVSHSDEVNKSDELSNTNEPTDSNGENDDEQPTIIKRNYSKNLKINLHLPILSLLIFIFLKL